MHNTSGTLVSETIIEKKKRFSAHRQRWQQRLAGSVQQNTKNGEKTRKARKMAKQRESIERQKVTAKG